MQPLGSAGAPTIARGTGPRYTTFDTRLNVRFERSREPAGAAASAAPAPPPAARDVHVIAARMRIGAARVPRAPRGAFSLCSLAPGEAMSDPLVDLSCVAVGTRGDAPVSPRRFCATFLLAKKLLRCPSRGAPPLTPFVRQCQMRCTW